MTYNIHIHLDGQNSNDQNNPNNSQPPYINKLMEKVKKCVDWRTFFELHEDLDTIGLAIKSTTAGRKMLCRVDEGQPTSQKIIDDYVFIGGDNNIDEEISPRKLDLISQFIANNATHYRNRPEQRHNYKTDTLIYGKPVFVNNEEQIAESQDVDFISRMINE